VTKPPSPKPTKNSPLKFNQALCCSAALRETTLNPSPPTTHVQHLPAEDTIPRQAASASMRELSLNLNTRQRLILIPACIMLAGGLLLFQALPTKNPR
jgi:hypothetical protein